MRLSFPFTPLILLALAVLAAGCAAPTPTLAPSPTPRLVTSTLAATQTPAPTETQAPTLTPAIPPTDTPTLAPSATIPPTPDAALASAKLIGLAWYSDYDLLLSFQFPGPVDPSKYRVMLEDKEYRCEVLQQFPDRLYCKGQGAKVYTTAWVRVYPAGSDQPGFEKKMWIPWFPSK